MSITTIPEEELQKDLQDSKADIALCKTVLELGIFEYYGGFVQVRLISNRQIVKAIEAELARRNKTTAEAQK